MENKTNGINKKITSIKYSEVLITDTESKADGTRKGRQEERTIDCKKTDSMVVSQRKSSRCELPIGDFKMKPLHMF